jgi:tetratricopeptide (TPR) repeat protein
MVKMSHRGVFLEGNHTAVQVNPKSDSGHDFVISPSKHPKKKTLDPLSLRPLNQKSSVQTMIDTRIIKITLAVASFGYMVYLFATGYWGQGIGMFFVTAIMVLLCLRSIRLDLAFFQLRQQKMDKAKQWLDRIKENHLWPNQRGYYHFLLGSIEGQKNVAAAERHLRESLKLGLRYDHDKAMANLNMALIMAGRRKKREALHFMGEAKRYDTKGLMKNEIKTYTKQITSM